MLKNRCIQALVSFPFVQQIEGYNYDTDFLIPMDKCDKTVTDYILFLMGQGYYLGTARVDEVDMYHLMNPKCSVLVKGIISDCKDFLRDILEKNGFGYTESFSFSVYSLHEVLRDVVDKILIESNFLDDNSLVLTYKDSMFTFKEIIIPPVNF